MKTLESILDNISEDVFEILPLKRAIVKARKGFRVKSPRDIEHLTFLALSLSAVGAIDSGILILEFIDTAVVVNEDSLVDLLSAIATSRLVLAYCYRKKKDTKKTKEILSRDGLDDCENFETYDSSLFRNIIHEKLVEQSEYLEELNEEGGTPTEILRASFECLLDSIILTEMLSSIRQAISGQDKADLREAVARNEKLFKTSFK